MKAMMGARSIRYEVLSATRQHRGECRSLNAPFIRAIRKPARAQYVGQQRGRRGRSSAMSIGERLPTQDLVEMLGASLVPTAALSTAADPAR